MEDSHNSLGFLSVYRSNSLPSFVALSTMDPSFLSCRDQVENKGNKMERLRLMEEHLKFGFVLAGKVYSIQDSISVYSSVSIILSRSEITG